MKVVSSMAGAKTVEPDGSSQGADRSFGDEANPEVEAETVSIDFPAWMVDRLCSQAKRTGVAVQDLIELWIAEKVS